MKLSQAILVGVLSCAVGAGATYFLMKEDIKHHYEPDPVVTIEGVDLHPATAKTYIQNYGRRVTPIHGYVHDSITGQWNGQDSIADTRCVWFPVAEIAQMDSILHSSDSLSGIRIYLAAYNDNYHEQGQNFEAIPPEKYWNKTTLIMVATHDSAVVVNGHNRKIHVDYLPADASGKLVKGKTILRSVTPENKGELCPPGDCPLEGALLLATE
ncbi:hypothetical protein [Chitinophaga sp. sic0106]|uniref:hypothetical protein n=1 Tax=Chitinophaga sp. sic0106 TaxID=2854785 RepID=UPI001C487CCC|nr:hypothetical protein [Chitinophaga sp. sic0106]MBV7532192.1 hypothetical protein [Chitinophaga sp. sic0106]